MVNWTRDEVVLVADAVRLNEWQGIRAGSAQAIELSGLLSLGLLHPGVTLPSNFRTASSIQRKSYDIATQHPEYRGKPTKGGPYDEPVLKQFLDDPVEMHAMALAIRSALLEGIPALEDLDLDLDASAPEGALLSSTHLRRERNPGLRRLKLESIRRVGGAITCQVCGFDFERTYGDRGAGYIEVHHVRPLHDSGPTSTALSDLALLCSNCHRMCHRSPWITPGELRGLLRGD